MAPSLYIGTLKVAASTHELSGGGTNIQSITLRVGEKKEGYCGQREQQEQRLRDRKRGNDHVAVKAKVEG